MPDRIRFELNLDHRSLLGKRNGRDQIAVPRHCDVISPWVLVGVQQMVAAKVIDFLGNHTISTRELGTISCAIFGLTPSGRELVISHDVWKIQED